MHEGPAERVLPPVRTEPKDVGDVFVRRAVLVLGGSLLFCAVLIWVLFPGATRDARLTPPVPHYPQPELQPSPRADMAAFYREEMARLNAAGWTDRAAGRAHIPIDTAMAILARDGIPGWPIRAP
jgi:hypothetical protein